MKTVHFSKRVHYFILLFLVVLVVILHYPLAPRELGADSYYIHSLGDSITRNGYSTWTFHALSYIGLYPESYPAAVPFLISAASQLSGLPMEETIYFVSLIFAFMGLFAAYMVAGAIWGDDRFKFIVAFAFSTSPIIIKFTNWTMSTRGLLLVLMPLILWLMIKSSKSEGMDKLAFIFSSILLLFLMALVHRMFWFVLAFLIIFYAIHFVYRLTLKRGAYRRYTAKGQHLITLSLLGMNALAMFMALLVFTFTDLPVLGGILPQSLSGGVAVFKEAIFILLLAGVFASVLLWVLAGERKKLKLMASLCITVTGITLFFIQFTQLAIWSDTMWLSGIVPNFEGSSTMGLVQGIGVVVGARTGVFIILALASVFLIPLLSIVESNRIFLIVPIMVIFPFFHIAMYFSESLTPFYFLAGGLTLLLIYSFITQKTSKPILKKAAAAMVFIVLISSLAFSTYTVDYRVSYEDTPETDINMIKDHEYDTALYLREYRDDVDILGGGRMMAFYGDDPRINASGVEVVRRSTPELFDFFGWYNFLKQPFGAVVSRVPYENYYTYRYTDLYYKNANLAGNGTTATAIGPIGATDRGEVTIRYVATGFPSSVSLYYSIDGGRMWIFIGNDQTADGEFSWTLPEPGTYHWYAATGTMANPLPVGRAPPQTEACVYYTGLGYNIYDNGKMRIWYRN